MRLAWFARAGILMLAWPVAAQVRLGYLSTDLSGTINPGYTADYGNMVGSDHTWAVGGAANLSGSFYNPNFLSFNVGLYLNQSRANSDYQSITDASGINANSTIFGGSRFPGSINYSKTYNSEGNYSVPGLANYVTHGNSDTLGINWSENVPGMPSLAASFQKGSSQYSIFGANDNGASAFHSLNFHSGYKLAGFNMGAYYSTGGSHSLIPEVVTGDETTESKSSNDAYGFNVTHVLPWSGSASVAVNRSDWNSSYEGFTSNGSIDTLNGLASLHPNGKLSVSASVNYSDNLSGQLLQSLIAAGEGAQAKSTSAAGGQTPSGQGIFSNETSNSLDLLSVASYSPAPNLQTSLYAERRTQTFLGEDYAVNEYGGSVTYSHRILNGNFNAALTATENIPEQTGADTLSFSTTENYSSEILGWKMTGSFGYAQNVQSLLIAYTNSYYNYAFNARRRWGKFNISAGAGGARSGITQQAGTDNSSQTYNASFGYGVFLLGTGSYSKANGEALATGSGLVPVPVPSPALPSSLVSLYGGDSYSYGLSSTPIKRLVLSASYAKSINNSSSAQVTSNNQTNQLNAIVQYQFRKLSYNSGFSRLEQGFSGSGSSPEIISSFYIGVSRWFKFF